MPPPPLTFSLGESPLTSCDILHKSFRDLLRGLQAPSMVSWGLFAGEGLHLWTLDLLGSPMPAGQTGLPSGLEVYSLIPFAH